MWSGQIAIDGRIARFKSPREASSQGVGMVHQHFKLVKPFTVAENILLANPRKGFAAGLAVKGLGPLRRTVLLTDPPAKPGFADWPTVKDIDERFYFRPYSSSLLVTACDETPSPPCDAQADIFDVAYAVARFEFATSQRVRRVNLRWAGLRTFAPDRKMILSAMYSVNPPGRTGPAGGPRWVWRWRPRSSWAPSSTGT